MPPLGGGMFSLDGAPGTAARPASTSAAGPRRKGKKRGPNSFTAAASTTLPSMASSSSQYGFSAFSLDATVPRPTTAPGQDEGSAGFDAAAAPYAPKTPHSYSTAGAFDSMDTSSTALQEMPGRQRHADALLSQLSAAGGGAAAAKVAAATRVGAAGTGRGDGEHLSVLAKTQLARPAARAGSGGTWNHLGGPSRSALPPVRAEGTAQLAAF